MRIRDITSETLPERSTGTISIRILYLLLRYLAQLWHNLDWFSPWINHPRLAGVVPRPLATGQASHQNA
jgi:hypothetical protein